jgi:hypothetical protein
MFVPWLRWSFADFLQPRTGFDINGIQCGIYVGQNDNEVGSYQSTWFSHFKYNSTDLPYSLIYKSKSRKLDAAFIRDIYLCSKKDRTF